LDKAMEYGMYPIEVGDILTVVPVWQMAYNTKIEQLKQSGLYSQMDEIERLAVAFADDIITTTNNPSISTEKSSIQRGPWAVKAMVPFSGQLFVLWRGLMNNFVLPTAKAFSKENQGIGNKGKAFLQAAHDKHMLQSAVLWWMLPAIALGAISRRRWQKDGDEIKEDLLEYLLMAIPFLGPAIFASAISGGKSKHGSTVEFWRKVIPDSARGIKKAMSGKGTIKERYSDAASTASLIFGTPQVFQRTILEAMDAYGKPPKKMRRGVARGITNRLMCPND